MTDAEELAWLRDWRARVVSSMRLWWKAPSYSQSYKGWTEVKSILAEQPPVGPNT